MPAILVAGTAAIDMVFCCPDAARPITATRGLRNNLPSMSIWHGTLGDYHYLQSCYGCGKPGEIGS
ncbi:MAG TPA: hypothetical protein VMU81_10375 [Acetobacteraceae bacterium]|jgi:hypothetical protein|nr:hypothetical protein [Acetobacteraceae bacterium]